MDKLALQGGKPIADKLIPIAKTLFSEDEIQEVVTILRSGQVRQGPKVEEFERNFAQQVGSKYAFAVSSGTAALHIAYLLTLNAGDEIIVPDFTFIATATAAVLSGAKPVLTDVEENTFTIDLDDVKRKITSKTKAIASVHLFGNSADLRGLKQIALENGLYLINDAAQAHGTMFEGKDIGSYDDLNCYSFYPTKNMTTGEGGMVTTNNSEWYEKGKLLRSHGQETKYYHTVLGLNYRMTDIAAAIGCIQLKRLDANIKKRRENASVFNRELKLDGITIPFVKNNIEHSFHQYSILLEPSIIKCTRDEFVRALQAENIGAAVHYPIPLTEQPILKTFKNFCPISSKISKRILSIPVHPHLNEKDLEKIVLAIKKVAKYYTR